MNLPAPWTLEGSITPVWQQDAAALFALSRATHALTLIGALFAARGIARPVAWFPAYYCENALPPLRTSGATIRFFPVTEAMTPDWNACRAMLADGTPDLFALPHFMGVENEAAAARAFCDKIGALFFEDASHVLEPVGTIGRHGDLVCYSPRKFFDLPDGGILVVRSAAVAAEITAVASSINHRPSWHRHWRSRRLRHLLFKPHRRTPLVPQNADSDVGLVPAGPSVWMSPISRKRFARWGESGLRAIAESDGKVLEQLDRFAVQLGLRAVPRHPQSTPYFAAYRSSSPAETNRLLAELRPLGAMVNTWPGLPPEIIANPERYGAALDLRRTTLRFTLRRQFDRYPLDFFDRLPARFAGLPAKAAEPA